MIISTAFFLPKTSTKIILKNRPRVTVSTNNQKRTLLKQLLREKRLLPGVETV